MYFRILSLPLLLSGPPPRRFLFSSPSLLADVGGVPRLFLCLGITQVVGEGLGPSLASSLHTDVVETVGHGVQPPVVLGGTECIAGPGGIVPGVVELLIVLGSIVPDGVELLVEFGCVELLVVLGGIVGQGVELLVEFGCIELLMVLGGIVPGGVELLVEFGCIELLVVLGGIVLGGVEFSITGGMRVTALDLVGEIAHIGVGVDALVVCSGAFAIGAVDDVDPPIRVEPPPPGKSPSWSRLACLDALIALRIASSSLACSVMELWAPGGALTTAGLFTSWVSLAVKPSGDAMSSKS